MVGNNLKIKIILFTLQCSVIALNLPIIRSDNDRLQDTQDMAIDESSPNNVVVHNTFHLSPMDNLRTPEMIEEEEYQVNVNQET